MNMYELPENNRQKSRFSGTAYPHKMESLKCFVVYVLQPIWDSCWCNYLSLKTSFINQ